MRNESWSDNRVYYKHLNKDLGVISNCSHGIQCYAETIQIKNDDIIELFNFHKEETKEFSEEYIKKLSQIFNCKLEFINEDCIRIQNFKIIGHLKIFATMFRYLFENAHNKPEKNVEFIKSFVEDKRAKDVLWKFIDNFNNVKFDNGNWNHCISKNNSVTPLNLRTIKDLNNNKWTGYQPIHDFLIKNK